MRSRQALVGAACLAVLAQAHAGLSFDTEFSDAGQPATLHYAASFQSRGATHTMQVWRDGESQLKRQTDDSLETFVTRRPGDVEFQMTILDHGRRIATRVDRSSLYRVGNFTDWYDLAHGIKHPMGPYELVKAQAPAGVPEPVAACSWYDLTQAGHTSHVCWDGANRLPAMLVGEGGQVLWQVTEVDRKPIPAGTFEIHDAGYVRNDVGQDMDRD